MSAPKTPAPEARFPSVEALAASVKEARRRFHKTRLSRDIDVDPDDLLTLIEVGERVLAAAAEGGESLRAQNSPFRKALNEKLGSTTLWGDHLNYWVSEIIDTLSPLISAHVAARVADAEARTIGRAVAIARAHADVSKAAALQAERQGNLALAADEMRSDVACTAIAEHIEALAQQPAPVEAAGAFTVFPYSEGLHVIPPPAPVEAAPDAEGDARRERVAAAIAEYQRGPAGYQQEPILEILEEFGEVLLAALPASDAAPAQGSEAQSILDDLPWRARDIQRGLILFRTSNNAHSSVNFDAITLKIELLPQSAKDELAALMRSYADGLVPQTAPARTEPSEVEAARQAEHEACIADCMRAHAEDEAVFGRAKTGAADIAAEYIRTRGAGGGA